MEQTITSEQLKVHLQQFTGTEHYYEHRTFGKSKLFLTDGCKYLAEMAHCYWLYDLILSWQYKIYRESFQVWSLKRAGNSGWDVVAEDGNNKQLVFQRISYSDFPIEEGITLFLVDGVVLLPSEN